MVGIIIALIIFGLWSFFLYKHAAKQNHIKELTSGSAAEHELRIQTFRLHALELSQVLEVLELEASKVDRKPQIVEIKGQRSGDYGATVSVDISTAWLNVDHVMTLGESELEGSLALLGSRFKLRLKTNAPLELERSQALALAPWLERFGEHVELDELRGELGSAGQLTISWRIKLKPKLSPPHLIKIIQAIMWLDEQAAKTLVRAHFELAEQAYSEQDEDEPERSLLWFYLAATSDRFYRSPGWQELEHSYGEHWIRMPFLAGKSPSFTRSSCELLQSVTAELTESNAQALLERGELERALEAGTLRSHFALGWLKLMETQRLDSSHRLALTSLLDDRDLSAYLLSLEAPVERLLDEREQGSALWKRASGLSVLIGALLLGEHGATLVQELGDWLGEQDELIKGFNAAQTSRVRELAPTRFKGFILRRHLETLAKNSFVRWLRREMDRLALDEVLIYALELPAHRDDLRYHMSAEQQTQLWFQLWQQCKGKIEAASLLKLKPLIECEPSSDALAAQQRVYWQEAARLELYLELWPTMLRLNQESAPHRVALEPIFKEWEGVIQARAYSGGLSLSHDGVLDGALSLSQEGERGGLTLSADADKPAKP